MNLRQIVLVGVLVALPGCDGRPKQEEPGTDKTAAATQPQAAPAPTPDTRPMAMQWGPKDPYGLQLGARIDARQPIVWCLIRNQGTQPLRYSNYALGDYWDFKSVIIKARPKGDDEWRILPSHKQVHYRKSAGGSARNVHVIQPGQEMPPPYEEGLKPTSSTPGAKSTFGVELRDFAWPSSWTGTVEIIISHHMGNDGARDTWKGTLESGPLKISMQKLAATEFPGAGDWGAVTNGLICRITTDRREYKISEPVHVLAEVTNAGTLPISFGWAEVHLSAVQGDRSKFPFFFSTTMHEFPEVAQDGKPFVLAPGQVWKRTIVILPWGPTRSSIPTVAGPGKMTIDGLFVYRPDASSAGKSVHSSTKTFEAKQ